MIYSYKNWESPSQPVQDEPGQPSVGKCKCHKMRCLRLNCSCFKALRFCTGQCSCFECLNVAGHEEERQFVIAKTRKINSLAFQPELARPDGLGQAIYTKGCGCRGSRCANRHCECFKHGLSCSSICKCEGCRNALVELERSQIERVYRRERRKRFKLIIPRPGCLREARDDAPDGAEAQKIFFVKFK